MEGLRLTGVQIKDALAMVLTMASDEAFFSLV
jgi:hypothetical protein